MISTEEGKQEAEDGMCIDCANYHDQIDLDTAEDIGAALRAMVASVLPSRWELGHAIGPRADLAEHFIEIAGRALVNAANVVCPDDWIPVMPAPKDARSKDWSAKKENAK